MLIVDMTRFPQVGGMGRVLRRYEQRGNIDAAC